MRIEVLLSTMHQTDYSILNRLRLECDAIIVNQCSEDSETHFVWNGYSITWINSTSRGLSRSRNICMRHATADITLLVDDDEELTEGYVKIIIDAFLRYPDADIVGFQINGKERVFKEYTGYEGKVGYLKSLRMASVELAFRRDSIKDSKIDFNEFIGAGTKYKMGEENTFLFQCLNCGLKIYQVPIVIGEVYVGDSTWFDGFNENYFYARGAVFCAMSKKWSIMLNLQFAVRKYNLYKANLSFVSALKLMMSGRKEYLKLLSK